MSGDKALGTNIKPEVEVIDNVDGNVFAVMGACTRALRRAGQAAKAKEMSGRVTKSKSYDEALTIMQEYCTFV